MCGINGIVLGSAAGGSLVSSAGRLGATRATVAAMNAALLHRGPDDEGQYHDEGVALGFRRLAINDLSAAGHQPMCNEDGTLWLVFNGEIYNYKELLPELRARGHVVASRCDAEVILHAYEEWGEDCVQRFNGMWSFAIWNVKTQSLFASRDRFGVKPFVYTWRGQDLVFSSEVAGLRAARPLHRANLGKLHDYLAYGYRSNDGETFFEDVFELPPAHNLVVQQGQLTVKRWWTLPQVRSNVGEPAKNDTTSGDTTTIDDVAAASELHALLTDAVRLRLRADVPVALLQSGGLDSSALCAIVNDEVAAGRTCAVSDASRTASISSATATATATATITAFTAVHPGHAYDESEKVRALMQRCPHIESVAIQPPSVDLAARLPAFVRALQEPQFSSTAYAHWCLVQEVHARGIKVMLNGQGADETLAGYGRYIVGYDLLDTLLARPWRLAQTLRNNRTRLGFGMPMQLAQLAKALLGRRSASAWRAWCSEGAARYLDAGLRRAQRHRVSTTRLHLRPHLGAGNLDAHLRHQLLHQGFNQILQYEDASAMSQSVEMRSPFVDYRVMQWAINLPMSQRFSQGITKRVLRQAFAQRLPGAIVNDHQKIGFATPFDEWRATPAFKAFVAELVASPQFLNRTIWDGKKLAQALTGQRAVPRDFPHWRFINAELWLREFEISNA